MTDIFKIRIDAVDALWQKSRTRGVLTEAGGVSLPETEEALGIEIRQDSEDAHGFALRDAMATRIQEIVAGRAALAGVGLDIEDDVLDQPHDPLLPLLYADLGVRLPALLAIGLLGVRTRIHTHRTECNVQFKPRDGRGARDVLDGNVVLDNRVHWYLDGTTNGITVAGGLSETMRLALIGEPLVRLLSHDRLDPLDLRIVDGTTMNDGRLAVFETDHRPKPAPLREIMA